MIKKGHSHLIFESEIKIAYRLFSEMTSSGAGLFISTAYPAKLEKTYGIKASGYIWLSSLKEDGASDPKLLNTEILPKIKDFMENNPGSCVFLDTVESIYADNKKEDFFDFMRWFSASPSKFGSTVIVPIDPAVVPRQEMDRLSGFFDVVMDVRSVSVESEGKECPRCGAIWNPNVTLCSICGYEFGKSHHSPLSAPPEPAASAKERDLKSTDTEPEKTVKQDGVSEKSPENTAGRRELEDEFLNIEISGLPSPGMHGPGSPFKKGVEFEKQGFSEKAIEAYKEALTESPNDPWTWINMGVSYQRLAMSEEALRCYDNAIKLNPMDADAWSNRAISLRLLGRMEEAVESYDRALAIDPGDAGIWSNKGVALRALGRVNEALDCYEQALAIDPYDIGTWLNKAVLLQRTGHIDEALQCYDEILRMDPYHPVAMKNRELLSRLRPQ